MGYSLETLSWLCLRLTGPAFYILLIHIHIMNICLFSVFLIGHKKLPDQVLMDATFGCGTTFFHLKIFNYCAYVYSWCMCGVVHTIGRGQRTASCSLFSLSTFMRAPGIGLRYPGLGSRSLYPVNLPTGPYFQKLWDLQESELEW